MSSKSRKLSLIGTIFVSMLSICSAAVSTFAWFQANANVNIQASSTSTSISVSKPKDYTFYYYNGNGNANYAPTGTFTSDFSGATSEDFVENQTLWTNIFPGQSMVFAMKIDNLNTSSDHVSLTINKFISNDTTKQSNAAHKRYVRSSGNVQINVGWAIDIYALSSSSNTAYCLNQYEYSAGSPTKNFLNTSNTNADGGETTTNDEVTQRQIKDCFKYYYSNTSSTYTPLQAGSYGSDEITQDISLLTSDTPTATTMYYFFRVYYSTASSILYVENDGDSDNTTVVPHNESKVNRYFTQNNSGTNNCYAGLKFALTKMSLTW